MGLLLAIHLGTVMALFLTLPYSKFAHGIYRSAALLKWNIEKRQPNSLQSGSGLAGLAMTGGGRPRSRRLSPACGWLPRRAPPLAYSWTGFSR